MAKIAGVEMMVYRRDDACPLCSGEGDIQHRRLCTKYEDDSRNILFSCEECYDDHEAYWQERWLEYYSEVL